MKMLDAALKYAEAGIPVFPLHWIKQDGNCSCRLGAMCSCKGKHPRIKNWGDEATTDKDKITEWWTKTPLANIGIPMGEKSGLVTLDVDTRHDGDKSLNNLVEEHDVLPKTITATTGGGGKHYIFKYTEALALKNVVGFRDGLDVRTQGGMIVAAPSMHQSGKRYVWDKGLSPVDIEPADMPSWLVEEIQKVGTKVTAKKKTSSNAPRPKIKEGGRNNHLTSLAGALRRKGIGEEGIIATLLVENKDRLDPPLDEETVINIAKSVARYQPEDEEERYQLTDAGNADRFVVMYRDSIRYCAVHKKWYIWNGKYWKQDDGTIISYAIACVRNIMNEANLLPDGDRRRELIKHSLRSESVSRLKAIIDIASNNEAIKISPDEMDANPWLLNCKNGTINLKTGKLQEFNCKDYITKMCKAEFKEDCQTPLWTQLLDKVTQGDEQMQRYIQKAFGYSLTGDTSEQAMFILYGTGSNGKSTLLNAFSDMLDSYAQSAKSESFMEKKNDNVNNDIARLNGARFVTAIEMQENKRMSEELIKAMTGGEDKLVTRFLYGEFFEYIPQFKVFLAVNHKPVIRDTTNSIWRRIKLIPFMATFTEQERDKNMLSKIKKNELDGILAWAVRGCLLWQQEGLAMPDTANIATKQYRDEMDSFAQFFEECCERKENARTSNKLLRAKYDEWCKDNGEYTLSQRPFSQKLIERGFVKRNSAANGALEWHGLKLRGGASRL